MEAYEKTSAGVVLTNSPVLHKARTLPDGTKIPAGRRLDYLRAYVEKTSDVVLTLQVGKEQRVIFSDTVTVEAGKVGCVEARVTLFGDLAPENIPKPAPVAEKEIL